MQIGYICIPPKLPLAKINMIVHLGQNMPESNIPLLSGMGQEAARGKTYERDHRLPPALCCEAILLSRQVYIEEYYGTEVGAI